MISLMCRWFISNDKARINTLNTKYSLVRCFLVHLGKKKEKKRNYKIKEIGIRRWVAMTLSSPLSRFLFFCCCWFFLLSLFNKSKWNLRQSVFTTIDVHTNKQKNMRKKKKTRSQRNGIDYEKWELRLTWISTITELSFIDRRNVSFVPDGIIFWMGPRPNWKVWQCP